MTTLCIGGYGYGIAALLWAAFSAKEGSGKHLYPVARTRVLDDLLKKELGVMLKEEGPQIQVVAMGCGMDTRPWRLNVPGAEVHWFDVDEALVLQTKFASLTRVCAEMYRTAARPEETAYPLLVQDYMCAPCDLVTGGDLKASLQKAGFSSKLPTIWLFEDLLGWMLPHAALQLISRCSDMSVPGSRLLAALPSQTCKNLVNKVRENPSPGPRHPITSDALLIRSCQADFGPGSMGRSGWSELRDMTGDITEYIRKTYRAESYPAFHSSVLPELGRLKDVEHVVSSSKLK